MRVTPENKKLIEKARKHLSYSDFLVRAAKRELGIKQAKEM